MSVSVGGDDDASAEISVSVIETAFVDRGDTVVSVVVGSAESGVWHKLPEKSSGQMQSSSFVSSLRKHVPPFLHGLNLTQGSRTVVFGVSVGVISGISSVGNVVSAGNDSDLNSGDGNDVVDSIFDISVVGGVEEETLVFSGVVVGRVVDLGVDVNSVDVGRESVDSVVEEYVAGIVVEGGALTVVVTVVEVGDSDERELVRGDVRRELDVISEEAVDKIVVVVERVVEDGVVVVSVEVTV